MTLYGAILADPPWRFATWSKATTVGRTSSPHYTTMTLDNICAMPIPAADDSVLFMWATWPMLKEAFQVIDAWGFVYKTCAFDWMKANVSTLNLFDDPVDANMGMGYWTRANSEPCLLATRGKPKRLDAGVRMGIIEAKREHSRKPDCVHARIERLVAGPYLEMFARSKRPSWDVWGNETTKFRAQA